MMTSFIPAAMSNGLPSTDTRNRAGDGRPLMVTVPVASVVDIESGYIQLIRFPAIINLRSNFALLAGFPVGSKTVRVTLLFVVG